MMNRPFATLAAITISAALVWATSLPAQSAARGIPLKELGRLSAAKENALVGYGIVSGLAGTGDSSRSAATLQSVKNVLLRFGVNVPVDEVRSRNSAAVMVTTTLPPYAQPGDKLDVNVSSLGDARSLAGGTLLMTHLIGPDDRIYALAQGPVLVGGFTYDLNGNMIQKNHPTAASIPGGGTVERDANTQLVSADGYVQYVLFDPDFATAGRIAARLNETLGTGTAQAVDAARIRIRVDTLAQLNPVAFLTKVESISVLPELPSRIVVNERTGTVVSGGDVRISPVTITHGDLRVAISTEYVVSQPYLVSDTGAGVRTQVVPNTTVEVVEEGPINVSLPNETSVAELVGALNKVKASSRDVITILQGIKRAGALHAELIIQ